MSEVSTIKIRLLSKTNATEKDNPAISAMTEPYTSNHSEAPTTKEQKNKIPSTTKTSLSVPKN